MSVSILTAGCLSATVALAEDLKIGVVLSMTGALAPLGRRFMFRTNPNDAMMAKGNALLMEARPDLLKKKWFIVYHDFVWGQSTSIPTASSTRWPIRRLTR
jgi:branched-chain amino acid transport system substrate-binding protein